MNENGKFITLFGTIFFTFIAFIGALILLMFGLKLAFGVLDHISWFSLLFTLFIICLPAIFFISVYIIYAKRTKQHPHKFARFFSYTLFVILLASWSYCWVADLFIFFKNHYNSIDHYNSFNLAFLSANIGIIFLIGIVQALSATKDENWVDKNIKAQNEGEENEV